MANALDWQGTALFRDQKSVLHFLKTALKHTLQFLFRICTYSEAQKSDYAEIVEFKILFKPENK